VTGLLLVLVVATGAAPACDLEGLQRAEARLSAQIIATPDDDRARLKVLFEEWDRAVAATNACIVALGGIPPED
jgi:hypothetical protein